MWSKLLNTYYPSLSGLPNRMPQAGWLTQQRFIIILFCRLGVQDQSVLVLQTATFCVRSRCAQVSAICPNFSLQEHQPFWTRAHM